MLRSIWLPSPRFLDNDGGVRYATYGTVRSSEPWEPAGARDQADPRGHGRRADDGARPAARDRRGPRGGRGQRERRHPDRGRHGGTRRGAVRGGLPDVRYRRQWDAPLRGLERHRVLGRPVGRRHRPQTGNATSVPSVRRRRRRHRRHRRVPRQPGRQPRTAGHRGGAPRCTPGRVAASPATGPAAAASLHTRPGGGRPRRFRADRRHRQPAGPTGRPRRHHHDRGRRRLTQHGGDGDRPPRPSSASRPRSP
jgi:hypothetical protein